MLRNQILSFILQEATDRKISEEYKEVNFGLTEILTRIIKEKTKNVPILFASSTQAELDNPYGKSKLEAEDHLFQFS